MGFKEQISEYFLNKSGSYRFYKQEYHTNSQDVKKLKHEVNKLKKNNKKLMEYTKSANFLLNSLFLDHEQKVTGIQLDMHTLCCELFAFVDNICKKYDLEWWISSGNLIGAVRHEGFIPWDDDTDIAMIRKDYIKFHEVLFDEIKRNNLDDILRVSYRKREIDGKTINSFIQIFIFHYREDGRIPIMAGIDVFPYDYIKSFDEETLDDNYYQAKLNYFRNLSNGMDPLESLKLHYEELNLSFEPTDYIVPGVEGSYGPHNMSKLMTLDADKMLPTKRMKYMDKMLPVPNVPQHFLEKVYGKYMEVPRSIRTHSRVKNFRYLENPHELFEKHIKIMKEVNENFE